MDVRDKRGGGLTGQTVDPLVGTATMTAVTRKSRGLEEFSFTMLFVPAYIHERRLYSATSYPTIE